MTYSEGFIHKLITIDTPYGGSPFAARLSNSSAACKLLFQLANKNVDGAVSDRLAHSGPSGAPGYYKHAIAGALFELDSAVASAAVNNVFGQPLASLLPCYSVFTPSPPAFSLDTYFGGANDINSGANDLIVGETSRLGPLNAPSGKRRQEALPTCI